MGVHHQPEPDDDEGRSPRQLAVTAGVVALLLLLLVGCCIGVAHLIGGVALHVFDN